MPPEVTCVSIWAYLDARVEAEFARWLVEDAELAALVAREPDLRKLVYEDAVYTVFGDFARELKATRN